MHAHFHSLVLEPLLRSGLLSYVHLYHRKHITHYVWRPSNRGDTQCIFSIWFRSDFGYFLPGSTLLQRFGTRKTSCYKDIASPEATSACNFRLQHILIGFHLIWSQVGVWTPRIWSQPCHSSPPEILVSTLFFSLL